jgi:hypothetical protein
VWCEQWGVEDAVVVTVLCWLFALMHLTISNLIVYPSLTRPPCDPCGPMPCAHGALEAFKPVAARLVAAVQLSCTQPSVSSATFTRDSKYMPDTLSFLPLPAIRNRPCFCSGLRHALVRQSCFIIPSAHGVRCTHHLCWEQQQPASPKAPPMSWSLRCRGPSGQATLSGLSADSTLGGLQSQIHARLGIAAAQQTLLSGFPPRPLVRAPRPHT